MLRRAFLGPTFAILVLSGQGVAAEPDAEVLFATRVLPTLRARCLACHGEDPKKIKGGLDLTSRDRLLRGGDSGLAGLVVGRARDSVLHRAVLRTDAEVPAMPPKVSDRLSDAEVDAFRAWIDGGAPWPDAQRVAELVRASRPVGVPVPTSGGLTSAWTNRTYAAADLWAYRPLTRPAVPPGSGHPVDAFLDATRTAHGLDAAPSADRRTLVRRVTFDLTGLPPTSAEVDDFLADPAPDEVAFTRVVERLLASPHYGEQMARHWLDVTRYADSSGLANDYERGNAWRYRDYVARAFAQDKPYDRFVKEQLAGDELDPADPEMRIAVGFLRMGAWELTGMEVPRVARQRFLDDVTDVVGQTFLGHMLQCARCHDHKFDPVPTRDYYRFQAAFATTQLAERPTPFLPDENTRGFEERKYVEARRRHLEAELARLQWVEATARAKWLADHPDKKGEKPPRHEFLSPADLGLERIARKGLERLRWEAERYEPVALSVYSGKTPDVRAVYAPFRMPREPLAGTLERPAILVGGDPFSPREPVTPGVLSAAGAWAVPEEVVGRRRALAEWVADPRNPLTARVMANRVWQWLLGAPLAGNPNNFGATGKKPTHPALLAWLAAELVASHYSVKTLQRRILTSAAYRRSSRHPDPAALTAKDPGGVLYATFRPRRLAAEELRDALLAASGELNREVGGIPSRPEIDTDVARQPRQVMGTFAAAWEPSPRPEQRHRRTLYALKLRGLRDPLTEAFNQPSPELSCEAREASTVAPQALALLNGGASRGRAVALAARALRESAGRAEAVQFVYQRCLARPPSLAEQAACLRHWEAMTERHRGRSEAKPRVLAEVVREAVEENTGVKYSFTEPLVTAADFVPDLHPADVGPETRGLMEVCLVLFNTNEFLYLD